MIKDIWFSLPAKDLAKSKQFFEKIEFRFHPRDIESDIMFGLLVGKKDVMVMMVVEDKFKEFAMDNVWDKETGSQFLMSFDMESKDEIDSMYEKAKVAGAEIFAKPMESGWIYGFGFKDPDGHRWNPIYMDYSKLDAIE